MLLRDTRFSLVNFVARSHHNPSRMDLAEATMPLSLPTTSDWAIDDSKSKAWGKLISQRQDIPSYDLCQDEITVGRGKDCDLILCNSGISGLHCKIWREKVAAGGGAPMVWVQDLRFVTASIALIFQHQWNLYQ